MKRINVRDAEMLALKFRTENGFSYNEPLDMKTVLRKCNILTVYRPLSEKAYGMSLRSKSGDKFVVSDLLKPYGIMVQKAGACRAESPRNFEPTKWVKEH